jgi:hypothetical protein
MTKPSLTWREVLSLIDTIEKVLDKDTKERFENYLELTSSSADTPESSVADIFHFISIQPEVRENDYEVSRIRSGL